MRLIFDNEIKFLEREFGIFIPSNSAFMDRMNVKVLDENNEWKIIYKIKAKDMVLELTKDNYELLAKTNYKTWQDIINERQWKLNTLENKSLYVIESNLEKYDDYITIVPVSGGKDSAITHYLVSKAVKSYGEKKVKTVFSNTTNETHHTYKYIKKYYPDSEIITPKEGFYSVAERTGTVPSRFNRFCCTIFKETPMIQQLDKNTKYLFFMGMRKAESQKRSEYETEWKNHRWNTDNWQGILPILEWDDLDVLLFMLYKNIPFNDLYTYGYGRVGCTNCPYRSDYELILNKEFLPKYFDRWQLILEKDFIDNKKAPSINCTLEEYKNGAWKAGIVRDEATEEIKEEFSQLTGIDRKISDKYFDKTCMCCEKKLKKNDIGLSMKYYGRQIEKFRCIKCLSEDLNVSSKELKEKIKEFKNQGCDLF